MNTREFVKQHNVIFVGPVRNGSPYIEKVFENIKRIGGLFNSYSCVFVESDSTDNSVEILNKIQEENSNVYILSLGQLESQIQSRTCRIALARNTGIEFCEQNGLLDSHEYYIHLCMDDVNTDLMDEEDFLSCFNYDGWAGMTANQLNYYDLWCLRCKDWVDYDCWYKVNYRPPYMTYETAYNMYVKCKFIQIPKYYGLIEVEAAHGGFSIFKSEFAKGSRYRGYNDDKTFEECDLVNFCRDVGKKGGKIFINSQLINMNNVQNKHNT